MSDLRTEGIIIRAFPFHEYDRIVSLFTPKEGLIKLFVKGAYQTKKGHGGRTSPLNVVEAIYQQKKSELLPCRDIEVINSHSKLRLNLEVLDSACDMLQTVLSTQYPGKASPDIYHLLLNYLEWLPEMEQPQFLSTSFRLKTLRQEGLLDENSLFRMNEEERQLFEVLTLCNDTSLLAPLTIEETFANKIKDFFVQSISSI